MARPDDTRSMALFCDFENVALGVRDARYDKFDIRQILERLLLKGSIVVKKAYCDWERYKTFKKPMHEANFELIEIPHVRQSGKNSADIRMVVDALDLCYTKAHVDTFVLITGDSDFSPLVSKLRENDKLVIGVGVKNSTSDLLIANCDEFIYYDDLVRERPKRAATPRATPTPAPRATTPDPAAPAASATTPDAPAEAAAAPARGGRRRSAKPATKRAAAVDAAAVAPAAAPAPAVDADPPPPADASADTPPVEAAADAASPTAKKKAAPRSRTRKTTKAATAADDAAHAASAEPPPVAPEPVAPQPREDKRHEAVALVMETVEALLEERGTGDKIWGSMVKQALKRRRPGFNESYYGFSSFSKLLEEAAAQGLLVLEPDEKSGGVVLRPVGGG
ncbi:MAG: NYN domain-containing protein [Burkholderiales bacterium]|jgi:uncharacterized protein (TIGR00288 family)|nr:NYN domain-containing protein [Burkholderiales bacterium]